MRTHMWIAFASFIALTGMMSGQTLERRAAITGGSPDRGKCTAEVVVDGTVEVEVHGDRAVLRNIGGQPPEWRRFDCSAPMPGSPADFRFVGVNGRGKMELVQDPRNGGVAVVRIVDPKGGSERYTFDLLWSNGRGGFGPGADRGGRDDNRYSPAPDDGYRPRGDRFSVEQAIRVCQDAVREQAADRLRARDITFRRTALDDDPGRRDWILGSFGVQRGFGREEIYRFSCSVNFDSGRVRSAQIEPMENPGAGPGFDHEYPRSNRDALRSCQRGVEDRLHRDGYGRMDFRSIQIDDRPGRSDWVVGNVRADRRDGSDLFEFSCSVNLRNGELRSVDVRRR